MVGLRGKILLALLGIGGVLLAREQLKPSYNPFDGQFNILAGPLQEECDTIMGECGYYSMVKPLGDGVEMYYQFYTDEKEVQAKGLTIQFDSLECTDSPACCGTLALSPNEEIRINHILSQYGMILGQDSFRTEYNINYFIVNLAPNASISRFYGSISTDYSDTSGKRYCRRNFAMQTTNPNSKN